MANIPFPSVANITSMPMRLLYIGDVTHRSIYTGAQQTLARAPGRWTGSVSIAVTDNDADRKAIESWLTALRGTVNTTEIPLAGRDGSSTAQDVWGFNAASIAAGLTSTSDPRGANGDGSIWIVLRDGIDLAVPGDYIRVGSRVYNVLEASSAVPWVNSAVSVMQPGLRVSPAVFPVATVTTPSIVRTGVSVRAQVMDESVMMPLDGEFGGPWSFEWIEVP